MSQGRATIWFCDPNHWSAPVGKAGCGFFGFYKPETDDAISRTCPGCGQASFYSRVPGELALIKIIHLQPEEGTLQE